jgi:hypothetical protein
LIPFALFDIWAELTGEPGLRTGTTGPIGPTEDVTDQPSESEDAVVESSRIARRLQAGGPAMAIPMHRKFLLCTLHLRLSCHTHMREWIAVRKGQGHWQ